MKKNLYYRTVLSRKGFDEKLLKVGLSFLCSFRLVLEVFIRKDFGERYFSFNAVMTNSLILALVPFINPTGLMVLNYGFRGLDNEQIIADYGSWYIFIIAFIVFGVKRYREVRRNPSVFDFEKFSLSSGIINPLFYRLGGKKWNTRQVEIYIEPLVWLVAGIILLLVGQNLGYLIIICSLAYAQSYHIAYTMSDHFVMDKIDELICNEELLESFMDDETVSKKGFKFIGRKPANPEFRRQLVESFYEETEENIAIAK